ncbi:MAG: folylpolyglutamate synthase/dihydrofolate synthase family protein [Clostridia bacterium]|nr:folylpolyglutamate synthase/dihydrofolate synthase family protein [Clostridia bacterium]
MNMEQAMDYIHNINWNWVSALPCLDREVELLHRIGDPQKKLKFIHIAGTNGKGSTAAMLASILQRAGYNTGLYTSPYIIRFNERIQVNGEQIPDEDVIGILEEIRPLADSMADHPTEFELVTAIGMEYFARKKCDIVVLEVGLGGEFDATNAIDAPEAAVMVNIGLDHMQVLGNTLEKIASAKAGIIKSGCDCVIYEQKKSVEQVFEDRCAELNVPVHHAEFSALTLHACDLAGQTFDWKDLKNLHMPLLGEHQLHNVCTVLTTIEVMRRRGYAISDAAVREGLEKVTWPGRFEVVRRDPMFIIDGGHNPQCLEALVRAFNDYLPGRKITFLNGCMADKDFGEMFADLAPYAKEFVTVTPENPRALKAEDLKQHLLRYHLPVTACATVAEGVRTAIEHAGTDGVVCACGSLYMIGDIMAALEAM